MSLSLIKRLRTPLGSALLSTFLVRFIVAVGTLGLGILIGRLFGPGGMGLYAIAQSLLLGIAMLARQGMDGSLMRYVGRNAASSHINLYLYWALRRSLIVSFLAAISLWLFRFEIESIFKALGLADILPGIAAAAPAFTAAYILSGFFKGIRRPAVASLLENGSVALLSGFLIFIFFGSSKDTHLIGYAYGVASWIVFIQGLFHVILWNLKKRRLSINEPSLDSLISLSSFMSTSYAFFVTHFARFIQTVLGVIIAGLILSQEELGLFKAAQQVSVIVGFILIVINAVFPPRFSALYHNGEFRALERLARQGAVLGVVVAAPLIAICIFFPSWVLGIFGNDFRDGAWLLRVIAIAQVVNVSCGSVGFLLNMTGHERLMRNVALSCNAVGLVFFLTLPYLLGALGAALALSLTLILQNLVALYFVWRRLGIWMLPLPNVLSRTSRR